MWQQVLLGWDWRDMGSTATWEVPCEETHRVRQLHVKPYFTYITAKGDVHTHVQMLQYIYLQLKHAS